jgi:hypothetical protein
LGGGHSLLTIIKIFFKYDNKKKFIYDIYDDKNIPLFYLGEKDISHCINTYQNFKKIRYLQTAGQMK